LAGSENASVRLGRLSRSMAIPSRHGSLRPCAKAGLPADCTFHGLRKACARRLADSNCTVHEIAAITGHKSLREVERYTRGADQVRLAQAAMAQMTATMARTA
jgi:integrase